MATGVTSNGKGKSDRIPVRLEYEGKKSETEILGLPWHDFHEVEPVNPDADSAKNAFYFGDNLDVLLLLLNSGYRGMVDLVYIDPPFATESAFVGRNQRQAYDDSLSGGAYVEFLRERLVLLRELLADTGSIYLHLDGTMAFTMKVVMDEVFGAGNCRAFITRKKCSTKNSTKTTYGNISDYIMFYSKTRDYTWNRPYDPWDADRMAEQYPYVDGRGRRYKKVPIHAPGVRNGETGKPWHGMMPPPGKHWQYTPARLDAMDAAGEIYWSPNGNPRRKVYCDPDKGVPVQDIWLNYRDSVNQADRTTGYPTEKNLSMLEMIVEASSNVGDLVLDCFAGSGTTLEAAFHTGRRWIGADNSDESLRAVLRRFTRGLEAYGDYVGKRQSAQGMLDLDVDGKCAFAVCADEAHAEAAAAICEEASGEAGPDLVD